LPDHPLQGVIAPSLLLLKKGVRLKQGVKKKRFRKEVSLMVCYFVKKVASARSTFQEVCRQKQGMRWRRMHRPLGARGAGIQTKNAI
jgi:hypothetical protein